MQKIGILASYNGSGFLSIQKAINEGILNAKIVLVISNNANANALKSAKELNIPAFIVNNKRYENKNLDEELTKFFKKYSCDYIFLSGFMKKIGKNLLKAYPNRIINTHPALLPSKYGGSGMYGRYIHEAVIKDAEKKSGLTIHFVNEEYDKGEIILKKEFFLSKDETIDSLEKRVKELENTAIIEAFKKILI